MPSGEGDLCGGVMIVQSTVAIMLSGGSIEGELQGLDKLVR